MKNLVLTLLILASPICFAGTKLSESCQKRVIGAALNNKETDLFLVYSIDHVFETDRGTLVIVEGAYMDAAEDYSYVETHQVRLKKGTCQIISVKLLGITEG